MPENNQQQQILELKAEAYDTIAMIEQMQQKLQKINNEILKLSKPVENSKAG